MEAIKSNNQTKKFRTEDDRLLILSAYLQCALIFIQVLIFPEFGLLGSIAVGITGSLFFVIRSAGDSYPKALSMILTSICLSPLYAKLCEYVIALY